jgi:hypothetical protein
LIGLLLLVIAAALVWKFVASGERFLPGFSRLLADPRIQRGAFSFLTGRSYLTGQFQGRSVAVRLQLKRRRYEQGYLVVAVQTAGPSTLDYEGIEARARDEGGQRALFAVAVHELLLSVEEGWLKAMWKPYGFIIFPGRFSEEKWRKVLEAMHALATSLEGVSAQVVEMGSDACGLESE